MGRQNNETSFKKHRMGYLSGVAADLLRSVYAKRVCIQHGYGFFWFISIGGIIGAINIIASNDMLQKAVARYKKPLWIQRKYQAVTSFGEVALMFALGYFWLGGFYAAAVILMMAMKEKVAEEAEK